MLRWGASEETGPSKLLPSRGSQKGLAFAAVHAIYIGFWCLGFVVRGECLSQF